MGDGSVRVTICLATYDRPQGLARCLESLSQQRGEFVGRCDLSTVVVDNASDVTDDVRRAVAAYPTVQLLHEPRPGIAQARNTGVFAAMEAGAELLAFLDDDEVATDGWLDHLLRVRAASTAELVAGPVLPHLDGEPPRWLLRGRFFERPRTVTGQDLSPALRARDLTAAFRRVVGRNSLPVPSTNNLLVARKVFDRVGRFDERFGRTGGSDRDFVERAVDAGFAVVWSDEATVIEHVPAQRQTVRWLMRRAYRLGNNSAIRRRSGVRSGLTVAVTALIALSAGVVRMTVGLFRGRHHIVSGLRTLSRGVGMVTGLVGQRYAEYRR